jgi:hypothetical protein
MSLEIELLSVPGGSRLGLENPNEIDYELI